MRDFQSCSRRGVEHRLAVEKESFGSSNEDYSFVREVLFIVIEVRSLYFSNMFKDDCKSIFLSLRMKALNVKYDFEVRFFMLIFNEIFFRLRVHFVQI